MFAKIPLPDPGVHSAPRKRSNYCSCRRNHSQGPLGEVSFHPLIAIIEKQIDIIVFLTISFITMIIVLSVHNQHPPPPLIIRTIPRREVIGRAPLYLTHGIMQVGPLHLCCGQCDLGICNFLKMADILENRPGSLVLWQP